jgi:hypothetical protein
MRINRIINQLKTVKMRKTTKSTMKVILLMTLSLIVGLQTKAQLNYADSLRMQYDSLDTKYFPSGILYNRSTNYINCFYYNSTNNSMQVNLLNKNSPYNYSNGTLNLPSFDIFGFTYLTMLDAANDSILITAEEFMINDSTERVDNNVDIPISIANIKYHDIRNDALSQALIWYDTATSKYTIMPDTIFSDTNYYVVSNPDSLAYLAFMEHQYYMASSRRTILMKNWNGFNVFADSNAAYGVDVKFSLPSSLYLTNHNESIDSIEIDFDDGNGYNFIGWNQICNIEYYGDTVFWDTIDGGYDDIAALHQKAIHKTISLRMPNHDGQLILQFPVIIQINPTPADWVISTDTMQYLGCPINTNFTSATDKVSIRYADADYPFLTKPIILVEGFESDLRDYGVINYDNVMAGEVFSEKGKELYQWIGELHLILDSLHNNGYDIIYVDHKASRDYIQRNALSLVKLIQWTNAELEKNNSNEKLVVLGASLGGLVTRYGIRIMEQNDCCHNVRLYGTLDSPHQGANIPIGIQNFVKEMADMYDKTMISFTVQTGLAFFKLPNSTQESYDKVINSSAARQMLIYHAEPTAAAEHTAWQNELAQMGHPRNCRRIAITNGSEIGIGHNLTNNNPNSLLLASNPAFATYQLPESWKANNSIINNHLVNMGTYNLLNISAYSETQSVFFTSTTYFKPIISITQAYTTLGLFAGLMDATDLTFLRIWPTLGINNTIKTSLKATGNSMLNNYTNAVYNQKTNANYPVSFTEVPGSLSDTQKGIGESAQLVLGKYWGFALSAATLLPFGDTTRFIQYPNDFHTFMPTLTTLDMPLNNLYQDIQQNYLADQTITPFDCYWATKRTENSRKNNLMHVEINSGNRAWLQEQILSDWQLRAANGEYKGMLSGYYNYGRPSDLLGNDIIEINKPYQTILYSLDIETAGKLYVNKQDVIGLSTGILLPRNGSTFRLKTNCEPCDSTVVKIKDGGQFIIGDVNNGILNKGEVSFCKNSRLEIFNNGQLIIKDSSILIIEDGATLVIHQGASILLDGPNAILEIRGKIVIDDNSVLEPYGDGFIRFAATMNSTNVNDYWQVGNGSYMVLANYYGAKTKKAEVVENLIIPDNLSQIYINAIMEIDSMITVYNYGSIQAQYSEFIAMDSTKFYYAFKIYGQPNTRFGSCNFKYGNYGLSAQMSYGGNTFTLDTCLFTNNYVGLYTSDEYIFLNKCDFNNNIDYGWQAEGMQANCDVANCDFKYNGYGGVIFSGQSNTMLNVNDSRFKNNSQHGLIISEATLRSSCSYYSNNTISGIYAKDNSYISLENNKQNQICSNQTGILLNNTYLLSIENGYNNFSGNQYFITGLVKPDNYYQGLSTASPIDLEHNLLPAASATQMPINVYLYEPLYGNQISVPLTNWSQNLSSYLTLCVSIATPANINNYQMFDGKITTAIITTTHFQNTYLIDAIKTAAMQMSYGDKYTGNDTLAIALFNEIFDNIPSNLNEDEHWAVDQALSLMITSLTYAIEHELIDPNRAMDGMPVDEYVAMIGDEIQARLNDINYANQYADEQEAYYQLLMAQMYRAAEHYDYALTILQNDNYFFNTTLKNQADYWNCICNAENQLLKGNIERSEYELQIDSCHEISTARMTGFMPVFGYNTVSTNKNENQILGIYPNPAEQLIAVEFTQSVGEVRVQLSEISGRVVWETTKIVNGKQLRLKLPKVSSGSYMLKTTTDNEVFNNKIIIR